MKTVYFDNSATTKPSEGVIREVSDALSELYGNPSSRHAVGLAASRRVKEAREACARLLKVSASEIIFTSGGSEGNNMALRSGANPSLGKHIVTTAVEHDSVLRTMEHMKDAGFVVDFVAPQKDGSVRLSDLAAALRPNTSLVSVMLVNNETGSIFPVKELRRAMETVCPRALLHTDAVQGFGKMPVYPEKWGVDLLTFSGHKIHALKGVGGLYMRKKLQLAPLIYGGGQEGGYRSGTENVTGIISLGKAVQEVDFAAAEKLYEIKEYLKNEILSSIPDTFYNGGSAEESPYILNMSFGGIKSEVLLNALNSEGVFVSGGSACASNHPSPSHVLTAMGCRYVQNAIRFSFSKENTMEEAVYTIEALQKIVPMLRR